MLKIILVIIIFYSFTVTAANEFEKAQKDSFNIDISKSVNDALFAKNNRKAVVIGFRTFFIINFIKENIKDTVYYEDIKRIRRGYIGLPFLKVVYKNKKKYNILSFRDRDELNKFWATIKTKDVRHYNSYALELGIYGSLNALILLLLVTPK